MKQMEKLGSQETRVLTDDQMKNVKGGEPSRGCTPPSGPGKLCLAGICEGYDGKGNQYTGSCNIACECIKNDF